MNPDNISEFFSPISDQRLPSLQALRCFEAAARLQNFSRAADELNVTHGAISRAVRTLEEDLGVALFERRNRGVFLTEAGQGLARSVHDGMQVIRTGVRELRANARQSQHAVLSCEPTLLMRWLIPRWDDFRQRHPGLQVHLVAGGGPFSFAQGIDMAIRRDDFDWPEDTHGEQLFAEKIGPVCRPDKLAEWFDAAGRQPQLRSTAPCLHTRTRPDAWSNWAQASGMRVPQAQGKSAQAFEHFYFSLQAAVAGLGVAIGPWHLVRDDIASGVLVAPMGFIEDGSSYYLLSRKPLSAGSLPRDLLDWIRSLA